MFRFLVLFLCLVVFLLDASFAYSQDKLENIEMTQLLEDIKKDLSEKEMDSLFIKSKILMEISIAESSPFYEAPAYYYYSIFWSEKGEKDSSNYYLGKSLDSYRVINDTINIGKISIRLAHEQKLQGNTDIAIHYYLSGINMLKSTEAKFWYYLANDHLGFLYYKLGDYYHALKHLQEAAMGFEELGNLFNVGNLHNKIGLIYRNTEDIEMEEASYLKAIDILEEIGASKELGMVYNNIAEVFFELGRIEEGFEMLEKAKKTFEENDYPLGLCAYYSVLAYYYSELDPPNIGKVIEYCELSKPIAQEHEDNRQLADVTRFLGEAYCADNQYQLAKLNLEEGMRIATKYDYKPELLQIYKTNSILYKKLGQNKTALFYLEEYLVLNDSLKNEQKVKEFTTLDMTFKFQEEHVKDSLNQLRISQEIKFQHEQELQFQKQSKLVMIFISIIVALIAIFIFVYARRNKNQARELKEKNTIINKSLGEKELLLKEIHHRVKNSLQLVSSLLQLQSKDIQDEEALKSIHEGQERVRAMALIHQKLYQNENLTTIDFSEYCYMLANEIRSIYAQQEKVDIQLDINDMHFDIDTAIPLGLILNELVTNSFKYAFSSFQENIISISIKELEEGNYLLLVKDNGKGLPEGIDLKKVKSLGLRLVKRLSKQLHGSFEYQSDNGGLFKVRFKDTQQRRQAE